MTFGVWCKTDCSSDKSLNRTDVGSHLYLLSGRITSILGLSYYFPATTSLTVSPFIIITVIGSNLALSRFWFTFLKFNVTAIT